MHNQCGEAYDSRTDQQHRRMDSRVDRSLETAVTDREPDRIEELKAERDALRNDLDEMQAWERRHRNVAVARAEAAEAEVARLEGENYELSCKRGDVMAGCDIQRGDRLYRQVEVVIGPGKTKDQIKVEKLEAELASRARREARWPMRGA